MNRETFDRRVRFLETAIQVGAPYLIMMGAEAALVAGRGGRLRAAWSLLANGARERWWGFCYWFLSVVMYKNEAEIERIVFGGPQAARNAKAGLR